jgi:hypothetical protein
MDEKGFIRYLKAREHKLTEAARRAYVSAVKGFDRWLCEHLNRVLKKQTKAIYVLVNY